MKTWANRLTLLMTSALVAACGQIAVGQAPPPPGQVELNVPEEVELKALLDAVSRQTGMKILYDNKTAAKKITIRSSGPIPAESLQPLLTSALRMQGLALVDADVPGWKTIVDSGQKQRMFEWGAGPDPDRQDPDSDAPVATQVIELKYADPAQVQTALTGLLTPQGGNVLIVPQQRMLVVTDFAAILAKVSGLIRLMDRPRDLGRVEFVAVENVDVTALAAQITTLMSARAAPPTTNPNAAQAPTNFNVTPDVRSNRLIIIGDSDVVDVALGLVAKLDVPMSGTTEVYSPRTLTADRLDRLIQSLLGTQQGRQVYHSAVDQDGNLLIVTGPAEVHRRVQELLTRLDGPQSSQKRSRIRFYKLKHINAEEALETIRGIQGQAVPAAIPEGEFADGRFRLFDGQTVNGPNRPQLLPQQPLEQLPPPPGYVPPPPEAGAPDLTLNRAAGAGRGTDQLRLKSNPSLALEQASVTADIKTNSIIVVADADIQQVYAELIQQLDQPQPQVLIEAKVVILDTTDNFALGIEISGGDRTGDKKLFAFSSYGLSTVNPVNGALSIIPGIGFNGTLVNPDAADVVLRAFTRHQRAKVVSSPRVLVSDNATGTLSSVTEIPFTSVNASQTVSTTSFAGFAQAGTTIEVTPHISEDERLQLKYRITRNDFQGTSTTAGVPPARQTDEIVSEVVIPDGHTLIVGGLNRTSANETLDSFPYLENVPVVKHLISNRTSGGRQTSLFIFLKPVILRDDKFEDLKYYSERDVDRATLPPDLPASVPCLIR